MGFDIFVELSFMMCPETGKPYYYRYDEKTKTMERVYSMPSFEVPVELRKYLVGRGHLFHVYTQYFDDNDTGFNISADTFLEHYPTWEEIREHDGELSDDIPEFWDEDDHNNFKALLEWCTKQVYMFRVTWSY